MEKLQKNIFYQFNDIDLLKQALTHRSLINNNERLEFLGDSLLSCIISHELYHRFPLVDEGRLTRIRSRLVRGQTLAELAKTLNLSEFLLLGTKELKSGDYRRESIQGDALEAIMGAIFLDSDYLTVNCVVLKLYADLLNDINTEDSLKDYKTQLQEFLHKKGYSLPKYKVIETKDTTAELNAVSYVSCHIKEYNITVEKKAESIKRAEHACAEFILKAISSK